MSPATSSCRSLRAAWPTSPKPFPIQVRSLRGDNTRHRDIRWRVLCPRQEGTSWKAASRIPPPCPDLSRAVLFAVHSGDRPFPASRSATRSLASPAHDGASQLLFAGLRFTLAGATVIVGMSAAQRRPPSAGARHQTIFVLSLFHRLSRQYFFFYLGCLTRQHHVETPSSRPAPAPSHLSAATAFRTSSMRPSVYSAAYWDFAGVALVSLSGADGTFGLPKARWRGLYLASTVAGALSTCRSVSSRASTTARLALPGSRCLVGGSVLTAIGFLMSGALSPSDCSPPSRSSSHGACLHDRLLAVVRACLPVNRRQPRLCFGFMNPSLVWVLKRAAAFGEGASTLSPVTVILPLLLVCGGIIIVS